MDKGIGCGCLSILALVGVLGWVIIQADRAVETQCQGYMARARTSSDTLNVELACERMRADLSNSVAQGVSTGVIIGTAASHAYTPATPYRPLR
jgi:hypothetical protein